MAEGASLSALYAVQRIGVLQSAAEVANLAIGDVSAVLFVGPPGPTV